MNTPPPLYRDQRIVDQEHLRLLAIFHFIVAGLAFVGLAFLYVHYLLFSTFFNNPKMWQGKGNQALPVPVEFFAMFKGFYVIMGLFLLLAAVGNLFSGLFIQRRQHRIFSLVIAALDCLQVPLGTILGVFTILALVRESVVQLYDNKSA